MPRIENTVFISYRRTNFPWALAVFQDLNSHGYNVFLDFTGIASGDFERVILQNIRARAHFLILLTPSALERCDEPGDWLRREIESALDEKRNIVPLLLEGFTFATPAIASQLTGKLALIKQYNAITVPPEYFDAAMAKLRDRFLNVPLEAVLHPATPEAQQAATGQQDAAAVAPRVAEDKLTAQQWFERGVETTDNQQRIEFNTEAIRLNPEFPEAFYNRGNARRELGDLHGAVEDYDRALAMLPNLARAFANRGLARKDLGEIDAAIEDFSEAIRLDPKLALAYNNRGGVRFDQGDAKGALADYREALRLNPEYVNAHYNVGRIHYAQEDFASAIADYDEALRLQPDHINAVYNRALARYDNDEFQGAADDYTTYLRQFPADANTHFNRGLAYMMLDKLPEAISDFDECLRIDPGMEPALRNRDALRQTLAERQGS